MEVDYFLIGFSLVFSCVVLSCMFIVAEREFFSLLPNQYRRRITKKPTGEFVATGRYMLFIKTEKSFKSWSSCNFYLDDDYLIIRPAFPFGTIIKSAEIPVEDMVNIGHVTKYLRRRKLFRLAKGDVEVLLPSILWD